MLVTGVVSSRIGPKRTLLAGLALIIVFAALAGASDTVGQIVGFRAGWGLGNALFVATALATIVSASVGSTAQAIILFEAALGIGIASGPLVGGLLGEQSWRAPFFGVSVLMVVALVATAVFLPSTPADRAPYVAARPVPRAAPPGAAAARRDRDLLQHRLLHDPGRRPVRAARRRHPRTSAGSSSAGACCWPSPRSSSPRWCSALLGTVPADRHHARAVRPRPGRDGRPHRPRVGRHRGDRRLGRLHRHQQHPDHRGRHGRGTRRAPGGLRGVLVPALLPAARSARSLALKLGENVSSHAPFVFGAAPPPSASSCCSRAGRRSRDARRTPRPAARAEAEAVLLGDQA